MNFITPTIDIIVDKLETLNSEMQPLWGSMTVLRMVEHLSDAVELSIGGHDFQLELPEDKIERAQQFLGSEHPMPKNFNVKFATPEMTTRNSNLADAIEEFKTKWASFTQHYEDNVSSTGLHPNFGKLNHQQWLRLHSKHITHHLEQFGA
ncbi:MAG: DUF1569 domain-containing protein [Crocinitomicaceae bacterium]|nr:DUF1569 domain-containing protein [Crocinitomicaceae bacterium]